MSSKAGKNTGYVAAPVRSAEEYFKVYAEEGIGKGADRTLVRRQLIDAFHKEMFSLAALRTRKAGDSEESRQEALRAVHNVVRDTTRKWLKLCQMFDRYVQTRDLLKPDDLKLTDEDILKAGENEEHA